MSADYVLALDQGTTSSRAIVFDRAGRAGGRGPARVPPGLPLPGPRHARRRGHLGEPARRRPRGARSGPRRRCARSPRWASPTSARRPSCGTAPPASRWRRPSCGRAASPPSAVRPCARPATRSASAPLTGLPLDAYFSGPKIAHILDAEPGLRARAEAGELCFGTVDSFLIWRLTGGRTHITDVSNASRTLLFDIAERRWDPWLCELIGVPTAMLPEVRPSSALLAETDPSVLGASLPIAGIGGDQMAATFGQACLEPGHGQEHLRHRRLRAAQHGHRPGGLGARPALDRPVAARRGGPDRLRPRGLGLRGRCGRAVAA